jgi:hypothetical protein
MAENVKPVSAAPISRIFVAEFVATAAFWQGGLSVVAEPAV